jgi:hypothetical protein
LSLGLVEIYKKEIWRIHGIPRRIISNRGPQFALKFMKELCNALGIERNLSMAYILKPTAKLKELTKKSKPISDHSSTIGRMIG